MPQPSIFVSHTREQGAAVRRLTSELTSRGFAIATNRHTVPPGKRIQPAVEQAMAEAARCLVCFSAKPDGAAEYDTDDVRLANERMQQQPADTSWLIPVKLTDCEMPGAELGGIPANELSAVELHGDWEAAFEGLLLMMPPPTTDRVAKVTTSESQSSRHATITEEIGSVMGRKVAITGLDGVAGANASIIRKVGSVSADDTVVITGVKA